MYIETTDVCAIADQIKLHVNDKTALVFISEETKIDVLELIKKLNERCVNFVGGIFPKVIFNHVIYDNGIVIGTIAEAVDSFIVKDLDSGNYNIPTVNIFEHTDYCAFTFVDGLASNISDYLSELYKTFGSQLSYFGGGAGSITLDQAPCVFNHSGFYKDAAVVVIARVNSTIGVKHGWSKLFGPLIATKTEKNIIKHLNWRNAFEVYSEVINTDANIKIERDNFFTIAKSYALGIVKQNADYVVRDALSVNEKGELICIGEVQENTVLDVLKGDKESLVSAAVEVAKNVSNRSSNPTCGIVVDCISRVLYLEDEFQTELDGVINALKEKNKQLPIIGALTLGEISSYGSHYLEFYNKTLVVGLFEN